MRNYLRKKLINWLARDLYNAVTEDDFLYVKGKNVILGKRVLSNQEVQELASGARALQQMEIWKALSNQIKFAANRRIYGAKDYSGTYFGKAVLFEHAILEKKIDKLSKL